VTSDTGVGNPAAASAEKGGRYVQAVVSKVADFLTALAEADTESLYE
jgi:creatinine amidohydrolase